MTAPYVKHTIQDGISTIEFFHPAHNSLPGDLLAKLADTITQAGENDAVKVLILKSGGDRTFCAGASFKELVSINDPETGRIFFSGFANVINAMRKCPKFIIGRIQGKTVGGGVGLASATDYCMASKFAAIKLSELNVGIGPFVVGPAVERKLGLTGMSQIAIDANTFYDAQWAMQKGLYASVHDCNSLSEHRFILRPPSENIHSPGGTWAWKAGVTSWRELGELGGAVVTA